MRNTRHDPTLLLATMLALLLIGGALVLTLAYSLTLTKPHGKLDGGYDGDAVR